MGVRIQLFAVDVPALERALDRPAGSVLWQFADSLIDRAKEWPVEWYDEESEGFYSAIPGWPLDIHYLKPGTHLVLNREADADHLFLRRTVRQCLSQNSSFALMQLLWAAVAGGSEAC